MMAKSVAKRKQKVFVDATNLKAGGGLTHLKELSRYFDKDKDLEFHVFGGKWIEALCTKYKHIFIEEFSSVYRQEKFKNFDLRKKLKGFDIVFAPGGSFYSKKAPYVTMCRNMLVFESTERNRFPFSVTFLRYLLLEKLQLRSFKNAGGIIYISEYAKAYVESKYPILRSKKSTVIYHGITEEFRKHPRKQRILDAYKNTPFKILYISIINHYKHQWNVIEAVKILKDRGFNITLDLVGPVYKPLKKKFETAIKGNESFIFHKGKIPHESIAEVYQNSDLFIYASTCENMPNILVEAMASGLPILSSNFGPMPEILRDGGVYMNPLDVNNIVFNLEKVLLDPLLREKIAERAFRYAEAFTWEKTAMQTFSFINEVIDDSNTHEYPFS